MAGYFRRAVKGDHYLGGTLIARAAGIDNCISYGIKSFNRRETDLGAIQCAIVYGSGNYVVIRIR